MIGSVNATRSPDNQKRAKQVEVRLATVLVVPLAAPHTYLVLVLSLRELPCMRALLTAVEVRKDKPADTENRAGQHSGNCSPFRSGQRKYHASEDCGEFGRSALGRRGPATD